MRIGDLHAKARVKKPAVEDVIIFHVGTMRFAISAASVDEIRNLDGIVARQFGMDPALAKVKSTLAHNKAGRQLTCYVVNSGAHFGVSGASPSRLLVLRDRPVALLADHVDRMMQVSIIHALPRAFQGAERTWYRALAVLDGKVIPMVDPASFLTQEELALLSQAQTPDKTQAVSV